MHHCVHVNQNLERDGKELLGNLYFRSRDSLRVADGLKSDSVTADDSHLSSTGDRRDCSVVQVRYLVCVCN